MAESLYPQEDLNNYFFWLWEYQRRNQHYINDMRIFFRLKQEIEKFKVQHEVPEIKIFPDEEKTNDDNEIIIHSPNEGYDESFLEEWVFDVSDDGKTFSEGFENLPAKYKSKYNLIIQKFRQNHKYLPMEIEEKITSDDILIRISNNNLKYKTNPSVYGLRKYVEYLKGPKIENDASIRNEYYFKININKSLSELNKELAFLYYFYKWGKVDKEFMDLEDEKEIASKTKEANKLKTELLDAICKLKKREIKKTSRLNWRSDNKKRAIGLWLWDDIEKKRKNNKKYSQADAMKNMFNEHLTELDQMDFDDAGERKLQKYEQQTRECIKEVDLFPMS